MCQQQLEAVASLRASTASYTSYALGGVISLFLLYFAYQVLLHPLHSYPGPFLAKFTDAYAGRNASKKQLHLVTYHDHCKYGSVFRSAPDRLVFNTVNAVHDILLNPGMNKAHIYHQTQFYKSPNIFGTLDRDVRKRKRKVYNKILSDRSMRVFEPTMSHEIDIFLRQLQENAGKPVNMAVWFERLTTDVAGQLAFGQALDTQTQDKNRSLPRAMKSINMVMSIFMAWPALGSIWPILRRLSSKKNGSKLHSTIKSVITARTALPKDARHDFYKMASKVDDDGSSSEEGMMGRSELWAEAAFIIPAGGTTVTTTLSAAFFYLCRHPAAYARLADEVRTTFKSGRDIQIGPLLAGCRYLRAVIDETLRVAPPVTITLWREPYADYHNNKKPVVVDGHVVPRGTMVGVNPYCVMHNGAYFPQPFAFMPERWLGQEEEGGTSSTEEQLAVMRKAHVPFALGETGCLGKGMAYMEISLVLARTIWYFDFETAPGGEGRTGEGVVGDKKGIGRHRRDEYQLLDTLTADSDGPMVVFRSRLGEEGRELQ